MAWETIRYESVPREDGYSERRVFLDGVHVGEILDMTASEDADMSGWWAYPPTGGHAFGNYEECATAIAVLHAFAKGADYAREEIGNG